METKIKILRFNFNSIFLVTLLLCVFPLALCSQTIAPGGPGRDAQWATAGKQGVGTSAGLMSPLWFTLAQGVMTEAYYPNVTTANVHLLQFIVVNPKTKKVETEQDDAVHSVSVTSPDSLSFQQVNKAKGGSWTISKSYVADSQRDAIMVDVRFDAKDPALKLYVYYDPSLGNSGMHDSGYSARSGLAAWDGQVASYLTFSSEIEEVNTGYLGVSDGLEQLKRFGNIESPNKKADSGNVVQMARIVTPEHFTMALAFGSDADKLQAPTLASMEKGFARIQAEYEKGWADYVKTLPKVELKYQAQFNMAAMQLKANEDKTHRGANVASLTIPWGGGANANENTVGGYHLVWSRDLYQVATAYMALGDKAAALRALDFLFNVQQKPDGSFPQNSFLDGKPFWGSLQMDEVAYPLILAYQLGQNDKPTYIGHVKKAADFIVRNGPSTPQERWEERPGYSPSTIAAEIAGLVCAADIAKKNGDEASALIWLAAADDWARNVERWTATTNGKYGDGNYYLRITAKGNPDAGDKVELNNGAGTFDEREIVDAGFLELIRLGIKHANDPLIAKSIKIIDQQIKIDTPNGPAFYRYNHDGYGEMDDGRRWNWDGKYTGKGRLWALLSGERGQYELAKCEMAETRQVEECVQQSKSRLDAMLGFANEGLMMPEQIWDKKETPANVDKQFIPELKFGEGTGSATPLAWSMAQFIRLAVNIKAGRNLDTPQVVYDRYKNGIPGQVSNFGGNDSEVILPLKTGDTMEFPRDAAKGTKAAFQVDGHMNVGETDEKGKLILKFTVPEDGAVAVGGVMATDGSTSFERVTLRQRPQPQVFSPQLIARIQNASSAPVIDSDGKAVLFYKGDARMVTVAGDINGWNPNREFMQLIAPQLWALKLGIGPAARTEYKIVADGKWMLDPANDKKLDNGVGDLNSVLEMPGYNASVAPTGEPKLEEFDIASSVYGKRKVKVYLPNGYAASGKRYAAMYFHDGSDYVRRAAAPQTMERLAATGSIPQLILVFVDPVDRGKEYWASDSFADFIANDVVNEVDKRFRTVADRDHRATIGASLGGITSLWIGLKHPETFSRLGGQSSSFWVDNERVVKALEKLDPAPNKFRFYLDDGTLEGSDDTRRVNVMLRGKGYPVKYVEAEAGHNWTAWRDRLADAFTALWR